MSSVRDLTLDLSPNQSSSSSDTGDVLIRSTQVQPGPVQITVQRLRDVPVQPPLTEQRRQQRPEMTPPLPAKRTQRKQELTKENRAPRPVKSSPDLKSWSGVQISPHPGHDLLTSRFAAGGRGLVLAALKQRSHSAPQRQQVRVTFLPSDNSHDAPGQRTDSHDAPGQRTDSHDAPVVQAASLMKVQCEMEARVSQLADGVQRLIHNNREMEDRGRSLNEETLRRLESLHSHQLLIQSQLLASALRMVTGHAPLTSATSDLTASGQRQEMNQWEGGLQVTHLRPADVCSHHSYSSSSAAAAAVETSPVTMATPSCDRRTDQTR